jgi:hypothetical protein
MGWKRVLSVLMVIRWLSSGLLRRVAIALMMEAASTSETSANFYQSKRRNKPQDSHLHCVIILSDFLILMYVCRMQQEASFSIPARSDRGSKQIN